MPPAESLRLLDPVELFHLCAADCENTDAWTELLRRYTVKLKHFIFGTLRQVLGHSAFRKDSIASGGIQENDLLQNSIVRLVKNDCAAMKRFSGTSEEELLDYLAVICRSSVLDTFISLSNSIFSGHFVLLVITHSISILCFVPGICWYAFWKKRISP